MFLRILLASLLSTVLALSAGEALAQQWPSRSIRFVVPLPPGGSPDYLSRLLAERLQPREIVGRAAGRQGNDEAYGVVRPLLRQGLARGQREHRAQ